MAELLPEMPGKFLLWSMISLYLQNSLLIPVGIIASTIMYFQSSPFKHIMLQHWW